MSHEHAWPAAWRSSGDIGPTTVARPVDAPPWRPALVLSGFPQAFDFFVWGFVALTVLPQVYFSALSAMAAFAASVAVWMIAYVVGALVRTVFAGPALDRDPPLRFALARLLFTGSSLAIAVLPAASHAPWSPWLLILLRIGQGGALGALRHGRLAPHMAQAEERRVRLQAWAIAAGLGLVVAGVLMGVLLVALQRADFLAWAWRYPFVIALALNMSALVGDLRVETERPGANGRPKLRLVAVLGAPVDADRA